MDCLWYRGATYDPIIIKSGKMIHIHMKHVQFQRGNEIFKPIIIAKPIFLRGPILTVTKFGNII